MDIIKPKSKTDFKVFDEVYKRDIYKVKTNVKAGEHWIDVGANIGTFALKCIEKGAKVTCYEPNRRNYDKLVTNIKDATTHNVAVDVFNGEGLLYLQKNGDWRHTLRPVKGRDTESVSVIDTSELPPCDGMKLDCEGSEVGIVYKLKRLPKKLLLEYDGSHHPLLSSYNDFVDYLKTRYKEVICPRLTRNLNEFFPNGILIMCFNRLMDQLEDHIKNIKFYKNHNPRSLKYKEATGNEFLHFGKYIELMHGHGESICLGSRHYPEVEQLLKNIAESYFPEFNFNHIQINKNVKTPRHIDGRNQGESYIFTLGDFEGGNLCTDDGDIDIYRTPVKFNGKEIYHWTGDFTGDRYCVIYY
jgi:FkbM family methyltransferase